MPDWDDERDLVSQTEAETSCWITVRVAWAYSANSGWQLLSAETSGTGGLARSEG